MASGHDSCNSFGVSKFCEWIQQCDHEFPEAVVEGLRENGIDRSLSLQLTTEELKVSSDSRLSKLPNIYTPEGLSKLCRTITVGRYKFR